jgi:hypothetical protein
MKPLKEAMPEPEVAARLLRKRLYNYFISNSVSIALRNSF